MKKDLQQIFLKHGIEYFGALKYKDCREINPSLIKKDGIVPESVFVFLIPYYVEPSVNISVYAVSIDYHKVIKKITFEIVNELMEKYPGNRFSVFADHSPIDERLAALQLGLGIKGENGLLINRKYGSFVFIGEIITDVSAEEIEVSNASEIEFCEKCGLCKKACPTKKLSGESTVCLSEITQKKGALAEYEIALMRQNNTVWGCDVCQNVCPHNQAPEITPLADFYSNRIALLTTDIVDEMSDDEFSLRAYAWRKRGTVLRNLSYLKY